MPVIAASAGSTLWRRIQARCVHAAYAGVNAVLAACERTLWPGARPRMAERVLIYRIGNIGDITCALPAMMAVRRAYPQARITLLTSAGPVGRPGAEQLLPGADWLDEILSYRPADIATRRGWWTLLKRLRECRFDAWIHLSAGLSPVAREFRDMAFARLAGVGWARGWRVATLRWALQAQSECLRFPTEVERLLAIVESAGFDARTVDFGLPATQAVAGEVEELLGDLARDRLVALAPGCKRSTNRWPVDRFRAVADDLVGQGIAVVALGGSSDKGACDSIARDLGPRARSLAGLLTLPQAIEVLRRCELAVCVDSGVQHLASAVGTPTVSLFSFWQIRGQWVPYGRQNVVIQEWVPCHTCLRETCPYDNRCMNAIAVDSVLECVREMLRRDRRRQA